MLDLMLGAVVVSACDLGFRSHLQRFARSIAMVGVLCVIAFSVIGCSGSSDDSSPAAVTADGAGVAQSDTTVTGATDHTDPAVSPDDTWNGPAPTVVPAAPKRTLAEGATLGEVISAYYWHLDQQASTVEGPFGRLLDLRFATPDYVVGGMGCYLISGPVSLSGTTGLKFTNLKVTELEVTDAAGWDCDKPGVRDGEDRYIAALKTVDTVDATVPGRLVLTGGENTLIYNAVDFVDPNIVHSEG